MSTEKYLLPNEKKRLDESITIPKKKEEVLKLIKDAPKTKATSKDTNNLWNKISTSLVGPLEDLMYEKPYDKAYSAGYNGDKEPKNPFKKDTLAYWFFTNLYTQGFHDN